MRKISSAICLVSVLLIAFITDTEKGDLAQVDRIEGLFIFTDSKPVKSYDYLGTVSISFSSDAQYIGVRDRLISKAKKKYPNAEGVILNLKSGGVDKCDVIIFK